MAGRAVSRARFEAEQLRIAEARSLPTEPRTSPATYAPALDTEIIALAQIGLAQAEIAAHWAISERTLKEWEEAHPSFQDAAQRARTTAKAWWQRQPRLAIAEGNNKFPAGAWAQQVRALFPEYDDKSSSVNITIDVGQLVQVKIGGLPDRQRASDANPLIEHGPVQRLDGPTPCEDLGSDPASGHQPGAAREGGAAPSGEGPGRGQNPDGSVT